MPRIWRWRVFWSRAAGAFLPLEGGERQAAEPLARVPLVRNGEPILRTYCAFWKKENADPYVPEFARLLKEQFDT